MNDDYSCSMCEILSRQVIEWSQFSAKLVRENNELESRVEFLEGILNEEMHKEIHNTSIEKTIMDKIKRGCDPIKVG